MQYAKNQIFDFKLNVLPEDLINDAYLNLFEKEYSKKLFFKEIRNLAFIEKHNGNNNIGFDTPFGKGGNFTGDSTCTCCKQVKPASEFRIENRKGGKKQLRTQCKVCESEKIKAYQIKIFGVTYNKKWYEKNKSTDKFKIQNKKRVDNYLKENREKWNAYLRKRYKAKIQHLS